MAASRDSARGVCSSLDQIGPLANSVEDAARLLEVICGHDERDSTSAAVPVEEFSKFLDGEVKGKIVGLPKEYLSDGVQKEIRDAIAAAKNACKKPAR
jgi:aspartyl-tRNA(Asn)/glutamyl-tRNA(Gln) amidotransferase subunit A